MLKPKATIFTVEDWSSEPLEVDCVMVDTSEITFINCFCCPLVETDHCLWESYLSLRMMWSWLRAKLSFADWDSPASSSDRLRNEETECCNVMTRASLMLPEEVAEPREDSGLKMASLVQPSLLSFCIKLKYYWRQLHKGIRCLLLS